MVRTLVATTIILLGFSLTSSFANTYPPQQGGQGQWNQGGNNQWGPNSGQQGNNQWGPGGGQQGNNQWGPNSGQQGNNQWGPNNGQQGGGQQGNNQWGPNNGQQGGGQQPPVCANVHDFFKELIPAAVRDLAKYKEYFDHRNPAGHCQRVQVKAKLFPINRPDTATFLLIGHHCKLPGYADLQDVNLVARSRYNPETGFGESRRVIFYSLNDVSPRLKDFPLDRSLVSSARRFDNDRVTSYIKVLPGIDGVMSFFGGMNNQRPTFFCRYPRFQMDYNEGMKRLRHAIFKEFN